MESLHHRKLRQSVHNMLLTVLCCNAPDFKVNIYCFSFTGKVWKEADTIDKGLLFHLTILLSVMTESVPATGITSHLCCSLCIVYIVRAIPFA